METSFWAVVETFTNSRWWFGTPVVVVAALALLVAMLAALRLAQSSRVGAGVAVLGLSGALALFSPALLLAVAPFPTLGIDSGQLHTLPTASFAATARHLDQALQLSYVGGAMLVLGALGAFGAFGSRKPGSPCPTCGRERHAGWNGVCPECQMMQPRLAESPMMLLGDRSASGQMVTQFAPAQTALLESSEASSAWLEIVEAEHGSGERFAISARLTIGRDPNHCQVVLDDEAISSRHAYIERESDGFVLHDWSSRNGTMVNGDVVTRHLLADGDEIALGTVQLRFTAPSLPAPQAHTVLMATVAEGRLTLLDAPETTVWQLDQLNTSLGRSKKNDVVLDNGTVSRHHADICFDGVTYFLVDAGASNGTWVDETRVFGSTRLRHGQIIRLGAQRLRFEHEEISYA